MIVKLTPINILRQAHIYLKQIIKHKINTLKINNRIINKATHNKYKIHIQRCQMYINLKTIKIHNMINTNQLFTHQHLVYNLNQVFL